MLYLVDPGADYRVTAYRVCWLKWADGRDDGRGAIVAVEDAATDRQIRHWFRATKTTLADMVEMGALSRRTAQAYLEARICEDENGTVYTYGDSGSAGLESEGYTPTPDRGIEGDENRGRRDDDEWR